MRCSSCPVLFSVVALLTLGLFTQPVAGQIRDGGIDPWNLGKGDWIYFMSQATNRLGGNVLSVTNENSLMLFYKSVGVRYIIIKAATGDELFNGSYSFPQFNRRLVDIAHAHGLLIFGYNRSSGQNVPGEIAISDYVFNQGADGFVWDAESEWESNQPWIGTNGPALAWQLCSAVRSNWPTKFLAHAPFPIISYHSSFPYKEFGYWSDAVMPQIYPHGWTGVRSRPSGAINWTDVNWYNWQQSLIGKSSVINGQTIYWTNAIKPLAPVNHVYGPNPPNSGVSEIRPEYVMEFVDYLNADPTPQTVGGYKGGNFWRADLHGAAQWANIKVSTIGSFAGIVNNIVIDDPNATVVGSWTPTRTFYNGVFYGNGSNTDTNSFGTNYLTKAQGDGSAYVQFTPNIIVPGDYKVYQWHPYLATASASVPHIITHSGGTSTVYANQTTNPGTWSLLGTFNFAAGTAGSVRITDGIAEPGAVAAVDGIKLVFVPPASVPAAPTGLSAMAIDGSQIKLAWTDNATNETAYVVAGSTVAGGPYTNLAVLPFNTTSYTNIGLIPATTYYYIVWATNYLGASAVSAEASATTQAPETPPTITTQPQGQTVVLGETATFNVVATGGIPLSYQWRFNGADIAGATNSSYARAKVGAADAGDYSVRVTNPYGSLLSDSATLVVDTNVTLPVIVTQPQSQTVIAGQSATFSVLATNKALLSYQWRLNGAPIAGATGSSYTRSNVQTGDAGNYSVVITNIIGAVGSADAELAVHFALTTTASAGGSVSKNPAAASYAPNTVVTLTATPANTNFVFTGWGGDASGTDNPLVVTLTINKSISATFVSLLAEIVIDNADPGWSNTSPSGTWTVGSNPSVPMVNSNYLYTAGTGGSEVTRSCRWTPELPVGGYYDVYVYYQIGANRTVGAPYTVHYYGGSVTSVQNQYSSTPNQGGWFLVGTNLPFLGGAAGYVELKNNTPDTLLVSADAAKFVLVAPFLAPVITQQPQPAEQSVAVGQSASFTVEAAGTAPLSYQWRHNGVPLADATASSYTRSNVEISDAGSYSVVITNVAGSVVSSNAILEVHLPAPPQIDSIRLLPGGQIELRVSGVPGHYAIESSTNFVNWMELTNFVTSESVFEYIEVETSLPQRFYRVKLIP